MADEVARKDANYRRAAFGVGDTSGETIVLRLDDTTKRLLVAATIDSFTGVTDGEAVDVTDTGTLILGTDGTNYQVVATDSSGNLQVEVLTMPTTTVTATDLDIRDLTNASDSILIYGSDDGGTTKRVIKTDAGGAIQIDLEVASVDITGDALTALQLIDDTVMVLGTATYTEASSKGNLIGAVRNDTLAALANTDNEIAPLQVNASGALYVDGSGVTQPVSGTFWQATQPVSIAGTVTVDLGVNNDVTLATLPDTAATDLALQTADLDTIAGDTTSIQTAVELIDDVIYVDDADWTDSTSKHALVGGLYQSVPQTVTDGDVAPFLIDVNGRLVVALSAVDNAVLDAIELDTTTIAGAVAGTEMQVDVITMPTVAVTGTFWQATQPISGTVTANLSATDNAVLDAIELDTTAIQTAVELIDNAVSGAGFNITQLNGAAVPIGAGLEATAVRVTLATDSTGVVSIDDNGGLITVDGTVTANLSATDNTVLDNIDTSLNNIEASASVMDDWDNAASDGASVSGDVAHDGADAGEPVKIGAKAVDLGATPTAVAANDRTNLFATRAGQLFTIGGHPNILSQNLQITDADGAQTDVAIITVAAGTAIVVTQISVNADNANTVDVSCRIGFGATTTPAADAAGVIFFHAGIPAGGGQGIGTGSGIIGIGATNEDLRITCEDPVTGSISVQVTYYTILIG